MLAELAAERTPDGRGQAGSPGWWPGDRAALVVGVSVVELVEAQFCGIGTVPVGVTRNVWPWGPVHW